MIRIPAGTFLMGSNDFYPEEGPVHEVRVDRVRAGSASGDQRAVRGLRRGERLRHGRRAAIDPADLSGIDVSGYSRAGWSSRVLRDLSTFRTGAPGGPGARGRAGAALSVSTRRSRTRTAPGRAGELRGCGRLRGVGRGATSDGGRVGVRRARRKSVGLAVRVGRRDACRRPSDGQQLAGPVPVSQHRSGWLGRHVAGRHLPPERLWTGRHDRQRLGVDEHLYSERHKVEGGEQRSTITRATTMPRTTTPATSPAARRTRAAAAWSPARSSRAAPSRAAPTCAPPSTAFATALRPAHRRRTTPRRPHIGFRTARS